MSLDPARIAALSAFARAALGGLDSDPVAASADASFRSYWRVWRAGRSAIVMDAPPQHEDVAPFVTIARRLRAAGLEAPEVLAEDRQQGFLLLGDLGPRSFLDALAEDTVEALYLSAMDALARMQEHVPCEDLPAYDQARLMAEMDLFPTWFLARHLGQEPDAGESALIADTMQTLCRSALEQPTAFVHRDYHSRNLMLLADGRPGILDFQDALRGPLSYDLVSLLKDCYIQWPLARVHGWAEQYRQGLVAAGRLAVGPTRWRRWFDWMGLQRHLKVLGIFARLNYRDGKPRYLADLPRVLDYVLGCCRRYGELAAFGEWLEARCSGVDVAGGRKA